jgi:HK97 family phage major capsid protein
MRTKDLRAERATIIAEARTYLDKDVVTAEDHASFDAAMAKADTLKATIDRLEAADANDRELNAQREHARIITPTVGSVDEQATAALNEKRIMKAFLIGGISNLTAEDRQVVAQRATQYQNAANTGTNTAGGFTIAPLFQRELLIAMKAQGGVRAVASEIQTETGAALPWPTMDDRSQVATIIAENTQINPDTDLVFGQTSLGGFTYKSGVMLVSLQMLQDSAFDFDGLIRDAMVGRYVRGQNAHFTTGSGTGQPQGVVTAAVLGKTGAVGQTTSILWQDLVDLEHSVDPVYRAGAKFMFHDKTLQVLKKLVDSQNRPLFLPGITVGAPDTIDGYPYVINQDMPVMAANAKSVLFGNFSTYKVRDILGMQMMRLVERYADLLQVGYLSFMRTDGRLISAATPIAYYANSAT